MSLLQHLLPVCCFHCSLKFHAVTPVFFAVFILYLSTSTLLYSPCIPVCIFSVFQSFTAPAAWAHWHVLLMSSYGWMCTLHLLDSISSRVSYYSMESSSIDKDRWKCPWERTVTNAQLACIVGDAVEMRNGEGVCLHISTPYWHALSLRESYAVCMNSVVGLPSEWSHSLNAFHSFDLLCFPRVQIFVMPFYMRLFIWLHFSPEWPIFYSRLLLLLFTSVVFVRLLLTSPWNFSSLITTVHTSWMTSLTDVLSSSSDFLSSSSSSSSISNYTFLSSSSTGANGTAIDFVSTAISEGLIGYGVVCFIIVVVFTGWLVWSYVSRERVTEQREKWKAERIESELKGLQLQDFTERNGRQQRNGGQLTQFCMLCYISLFLFS